MFDFDAGKLLILGVVALVVIGPKELPGVMRQVGQAVAKLRRMAAEFQSQFMEAMREAELDDLKKELASVQEAAKIDVDFNPVEDVKREMTAAVTPPSESAAAGPSEPAQPIAAPASRPALPQPVQPDVPSEAASPTSASPTSATASPAAMPHDAGTLDPSADAGPPPATQARTKALPTTGSAAEARASDGAAKPARKRVAETDHGAPAAPADPAGPDAVADGAASVKRKRSAKKPAAQSDDSSSAAPELARSRQRRKSGAP